MEAWLRLLVAVVLILIPSALFVGLRRGLARLRDDELVGRLVEAGHLDPSAVEGMGSLGSEDRSAEGDRRGATHDPNANVTARRGAFLSDRDDHKEGTGSAEHTTRKRNRCETCGALNPDAIERCWQCLEPIE
jgi:hypothetical protein